MQQQQEEHLCFKMFQGHSLIKSKDDHFSITEKQVDKTQTICGCLYNEHLPVMTHWHCH